MVTTHPTSKPAQMLCRTNHKVHNLLSGIQELPTGIYDFGWSRGKRWSSIDVKRWLWMAIGYEEVIYDCSSLGNLRCQVRQHLSHCVQGIGQFPQCYEFLSRSQCSVRRGVRKVQYL